MIIEINLLKKCYANLTKLPFSHQFYQTLLPENAISWPIAIEQLRFSACPDSQIKKKKKQKSFKKKSFHNDFY